MAHRPYPNVDRALHQIGRHYPDVPVIPMSPALQSTAEGFRQIRAGLQGAAGRAGTYILSTRRTSGQIRVTDGESSAVAIDSSAIRPWTRAEVEGWYRGEGSPRPGTVSGPA
ncbi:hypothetical protein ABZX82_02280 [Streptomyces griseoflavus]|uniref:hypothetical protein n=1 Tax=Streptomyces griseoflavus TaxID=35619 RepID=UPI0033A8F082